MFLFKREVMMCGVWLFGKEEGGCVRLERGVWIDWFLYCKYKLYVGRGMYCGRKTEKE